MIFYFKKCYWAITQTLDYSKKQKSSHIRTEKNSHQVGTESSWNSCIAEVGHKPLCFQLKRTVSGSSLSIFLICLRTSFLVMTPNRRPLWVTRVCLRPCLRK